LALRAGYATLVAAPDMSLRIEAPGQDPTLNKDEEATQLPLLAEDGKANDYARSRGALRQRAALCVAASGRVFVARVRHDSSDVLASALLRTGCNRVVELDRGSHHPAFVHRTGTATPPVGGYETSVLYALGRAMQPHAFRWKHEQARPSDKPTGYDIHMKKDVAETDPTASPVAENKAPRSQETEGSRVGEPE
jgi:hypothetical protein